MKRRPAPPSRPSSLSAADARGIALVAQQFHGAARSLHAPANRVDHKSIRSLISHLGVVQIDSVNVLVRSHYLPAFSRLGAYTHSDLDRLSHEHPRSLFEYWGHEASLLPVALQPFFRWRMAQAEEKAWGRIRRMAKKNPTFIASVLDTIRERGPLTASQLEPEMEQAGLLPKRTGRKKSGWWEWSDTKTAIEFLFWSGQVTSSGRRGFERIYDMPERVIGKAILAQPTPTERDAHRYLLDRAGRGLGIGTEADLRDYYRLPVAGARAALADAVESGTFERVSVEGWAKPAYLHKSAWIPSGDEIDPDRGALLSPFDSLIWFRDRTERLFGMRYRIEIYTPAPKRVHGYYVLPLLLGDELVARVDLKADRAAGILRVQAAHAERTRKRGVTKARVTTALAGELSRMASWLGLAGIEVMPRGDLAASLARLKIR
ncbi:MAG TPA: crosslink repair DNA glycosylase YcaQ family protein [Kofleriaceae bacterium]|nr:crosslink repair DNA glycosylase YcaQ family protein [Kofleriaceae bacterium]